MDWCFQGKRRLLHHWQPSAAVFSTLLCIPSCFWVTCESWCLLCTLNISFPVLCFIPRSVSCSAKGLKRCSEKIKSLFLVVGWVEWHSGITRNSSDLFSCTLALRFFCGMEFLLFLQLFHCHALINWTPHCVTQQLSSPKISRIGAVQSRESLYASAAYK